METIVGRRATEGVVVPHVQLDIVLSDAAEGRVVGTGGHRAKRRTPELALPVRRRSLRHRRRSRSGRASRLAVHLFHGLGCRRRYRRSPATRRRRNPPELRRRLGRGLPETVEHGAPRTEPAHAVVGVGNGAAKCERTDIERHVPADRWGRLSPPACRADPTAPGSRRREARGCVWKSYRLGRWPLSTSSTLNPWRARSMAVGEPAHRAPTMMASSSEPPRRHDAIRGRRCLTSEEYPKSRLP